MCKIIVMKRHKPSKRDEIISSAWGYFSRSGERCGFGAAWVGSDGKLGWVKSSCPELKPTLPAWGDGFASSRGLGGASDGGWLLIHGRTATCGVNVENTHPIIDGECALIHNGVVSSDRFKNTETTCDSELLIHAYRCGPSGLADISGYFAFAMLHKTASGWSCVVARDDKARLRVGRIGKSWAWGTTDEALTVVGAAPICDHRPMRAAEFGPDGSCTVKSFRKGAERKSLARGWEIASGRAALEQLWPVEEVSQ